MTETSLPTDDGPPDRAGVASTDAPEVVRRPRVRRRILWTAIVVVSLSLIAGVLFIPTPYYLFEPGSVRPAETRIDVTGTRSFETKGEVLFTTVYVDQATLATLLRGALDDAVEVKSEQDVYGPEGRNASQKANQQRMDLSKLVATKVALQYLGYPASFTAKGAKVLGLEEHGPAAGQIRVGDVITSVAGHGIALPADIQVALQGKVPGDVVPVVVRRSVGAGTDSVDVAITLGSAPVADDAGATTSTPTTSTPTTGTPTTASGASPAVRPIIGVSVEPDQPTVDSPVHVAIDSGDVTGPSAGLAWALAVVDRLTPASLTSGKDVAVTGEILPDGSVGPIGGIVQKVAAVKRAGVKTFLYPSTTDPKDVRQMKAVAGDAVRVVPVATLAEAVEALHPGGVSIGR